jgi:hypothetical protein
MTTYPRRRSRVPRRATEAICLAGVFVLTIAACSASPPDKSARASEAQTLQAETHFVQCLRSRGVVEPEPHTGPNKSGYVVEIPPSGPTTSTALSACTHYLPNFNKASQSGPHNQPTATTTPSAPSDAGVAPGSGQLLRVGRWLGLTGTYPTIQAAVNAAHPGDRIVIAAGDYRENPDSGTGVHVATPDIVIEGADRNTVIVDGTKPGAPIPCDPEARFQDFGPVTQQPGGEQQNGRNGIVIDHVSGVTVENLTICNFVGTGSANQYGNELWFNGGAGTGTTGLGSYHVADVTTFSTYIPAGAGFVPMEAVTGILISNASGPGDISDSFASNMADSGYHIAGCPDCNAVFDQDTANHNVIGLSGTDAGGRLVVENSIFEHNGAGVNLASENNEDAPPPQNGACPPGVPGPEPVAGHICTVIEHNTVTANNNTDISPQAAQVFLGAGIDVAGGQHDLIYRNQVSDQGSYGIVTTIYENTGSSRYPNADCQGGRQLNTNLCFFNAAGNLIADNTLQHDGTFANPTNGDLADATLADVTPNCYQDNADPAGQPTMAPLGLQTTQGCRAPGRGALFSALGVQVACAVQAFGACTNGYGNASLQPLQTLSQLVHTAFDPSALANTRANYPSSGQYTAPPPPSQPSLHL